MPVRTARWKLRACPKCRGDLIVDRDERDEPQETCLQCGLVRYPGMNQLAWVSESTWVRKGEADGEG